MRKATKRAITGGIAAGVLAAASVLGATSANADNSQNAELKLYDSSGDLVAWAYLDADADHAAPGKERLVVEDRKADGRGTGTSSLTCLDRPDGDFYDAPPCIRDDGADGHGVKVTENWAKEGTTGQISLCSIKKGTDSFCTDPEEVVY